jgi:DNA-directed RNA polymerase subunit RPC12/RpoP
MFKGKARQLHEEPCPKVVHEFKCTFCDKYFDIKLNISLKGNYRVHCPNCGHIHYRVIIDGRITDARFPDNHTSILIEDIMPMKSSCHDTLRETEKDSYFNEDKDVVSALHRLWKEKFSARGEV